MSVASRQTVEPVSFDGSTGGRGGRGLFGRLSRGHWLAVVLSVVAGLTVWAAVQDRDATVRVAVADRSLASAAPVSEDAVRWVEVSADSQVADGLVDESAFAGGEWVAARPIEEGEPLTEQALVPGAAGDGQRSMAVPVPRERAVHGALEPGDRVDVVDVVDGEAVFVVTDAEVLAVQGEREGSVGEAPGSFGLTLAVDADEALGLATAAADDSLDVVRSTGAPTVAAAEAPDADSSDDSGDLDGGDGDEEG